MRVARAIAQLGGWTMAHKTKAQAWSYLAGKKGKNRVRVYEDGKGGPLLLEYQEPVFDNQGPVIDPATGKQRTRRARVSLTAAEITTRAEAIKKAEEWALRCGEPGAAPAPRPSGPVTLGRLLDLYFAEVVPNKKPDTQRQNDTDRRMFLAFFGPDAVVERIGPDGRPQTEMGRVRYNDFIRARKEGSIRGFAKAKGQTIKNDVRFLRAVFRWGKLEREDGSVLLLRNPWEGFPVPAGDKPLRQEMTPELHRRLVEHAANWRMGVVLDLCRETRRRMNSVRQLALADIDLTAGIVRWRGEFDKVGKTRVTPLTSRAIETIRRALAHRREEGLGDSPWLIPAEADATKPIRRTRLDNWMRATKKAQGIHVHRLGYHGEKRAGIRDPKFRRLDPAVQEELAGTTWETMRRVYDYVDLPTLQSAVALLEGDAAPTTGRTRRRNGLKSAA
jgi:integrase